MALPYLSSSACFLHTCKNSCCRSSHLQLTCSHSPSPLLYSPVRLISFFHIFLLHLPYLIRQIRFANFVFLFQVTVFSPSSLLRPPFFSVLSELPMVFSLPSLLPSVLFLLSLHSDFSSTNSNSRSHWHLLSSSRDLSPSFLI